MKKVYLAKAHGFSQIKIKKLISGTISSGIVAKKRFLNPVTGL